ncbi:DNA-directed DNA polymerase alpha catalytic subunit pol1 [Haplosporangium sp. Z 767]|nr:DNA-directed DNA polymerase alpha catalytic subunit pol1 [Haplosporangium sp. Z 11]KAF9189194.1 DNA-directed DNA polymerase alpha catalytic subunit pol1 [Haplosporangium sp. Z 767]
MSGRTKRRSERNNSALDELRAARAAREAGISRIHQYEVEEPEIIYDEVDDDRIKKRLRQDHDNFVEDDDGRGYAYEDDDEERELYSDEYYEDDIPSKGSKKNSKGKSVAKDVPKPKAKENIRDAFMRVESRPKVPRATTHNKPAASDDFMASLLQSVDESTETTPTKKSSFSNKINNTPTRVLVSKMIPMKIKDEADDDIPRSFASRFNDIDTSNDFDPYTIEDTPAPEMGDEIKEIKTTIKKEWDGNPFHVEEPTTSLAVKDITVMESKTPMKLVNDTSKKEKATVVKESEKNTRQNWMTVDSNLNQSFTPAKVETESLIDVQESTLKEEDGTLRMYWIDACEVKGVVYLFGKVLQRASKKYISCCVAVHNMERNLFVLPRPHRVDQHGNETDIEVDMADVYTEFDTIRQAHKITSWLSKLVERKYAFELPGIPSSAEYLKVVYKYSLPSLPADLKGETFSHVFGTTTSALEHFVIKRNLMGPSWLEIKNARMTNTKVSWCKSEFTVQNAKDITPLKESPGLPPPPLCVMSLSLRTVINPKDKSNEIVSVSTTVYHEVRLDDPVESNRKNVTKQILVRPLTTSPFPPGFDRVIDRSKVKVMKQTSERTLLNFLLASIFNTDPDVIVGHNFVGFDLDVLLHRMKHTKADHWSRVGRLRRTIWPKLQMGAGGMGDTTAQEKNIMSGRLMCDTYIGAKEHVRAKSYSLTNLVAMQLGVNREDIDYEKVPSYFSNAEALEMMLRHSDFDTYLCAELMFSLQLLPLSRQLTTLSGNLWSITLTAGRAVRNEYLLLHEFHRNKYICPDKTYYRDNKDAPMVNVGEMDDQDDTAAPKKGARRKPQYSGGLVLEPKKGFYDQFVLLLDFNSLYPSIIQEYNICFTTVKHDKEKDDETLPNYPEEGLPQGILPKLLANLVERRREVKKLMKTASGSKYEEYDIRQKGLKLTANSMYGCLGAVYSRFYAKQLAMLITSRGREILQNTVDLATEIGLDVIYGDTDSIMINTNTSKVEEVKLIAEGLKKIVNARYKLLEIEMDGMYQRMLLLKKKKYAALMVVEKSGKYETVVETKGLDMVRRDWCGLSQDVSNYVLNQILSGNNQDREQVVENIHNYLRTVGEETRKGLIPIEKFVVNKGLTKAPEDYADAKTQPHVQVALRLKGKGISVRAGDTVPYVICLHEDVPTPKGSYADRAYHPDEVLQPGSGLTIDFEYYLNQQVHPPLDRLCGPIEGTDATRLADCLGLDTSKFRSAVRPSDQDEEFQTLGSQLSDAERYKDAEPLELRCRACQTVYKCSALLMETESSSHFGLQCPNCSTIAQPASAGVQLTLAIRKYIQRYYQGWVVCDDQGCRNRTRMVSVVGRRCLVEGCYGRMHNEFSDGSLYTQLSYFSHIFDTQKVLDKVDFEKNGAIRVLIEQNRELIRQLKANADKYIDKNARRFVDLSQLFSFVKISR